MKQKIISNTNPAWPNIEVIYNRPIDLYIDKLKGYVENTNYKILWVKEVDEISNFKWYKVLNTKEAHHMMRLFNFKSKSLIYLTI